MERERRQRKLMNIGSHPSYRNNQSYDSSNTRDYRYKKMIKCLREIFRPEHDLVKMLFYFKNDFQKTYNVDFSNFRVYDIDIGLFHDKYRNRLLQLRPHYQPEEFRIFTKHLILLLCTPVKDIELLEYAMNHF